MDGFSLHKAMYVHVANEKEALIREAINLHMLAGCSKDVGHVSAEKNADHVTRLGVGGHKANVSSLGDGETTSQGGFGNQIINFFESSHHSHRVLSSSDMSLERDFGSDTILTTLNNLSRA